MDQYRDPYRNLKAQEDEITKIMATLSIQESLKSVLLDTKTSMCIDLKKIVRVLQLLLSDQMLYQNNKLKHKVLESKNGWLQINYILCLKEIQNTLKQVEFFIRIERKLLIKFIRTELELYPCSLMANQKYIRRKVPFLDKISLVKPIQIQGYKEQERMVAISEILASITQIYKLKFRIGNCWGLVYAAEPQKILEFSQFNKSKRMEIDKDDDRFNDYYEENLPFKALEYEKSVQFNPPPNQKYTKKYLHSTALKPFLKAFIDSELQGFKIKFIHRFNDPDFNRREMLANLSRITESTMPSENEDDYEGEEQGLVMEDIHNMRREELLRQKEKCDEKLKNCIKFYRPCLELNSKSFTKESIFCLSSNRQLKQRSSLTKNEEQIIDAAIDQDLFTFDKTKTKIE